MTTCVMPSTNTSIEGPVRRRILVIDHHPLVRRGLIALIESEPDVIVCGEVAAHQNALAAIADCHPDLVIIDPFEDRNGLATIRDIRSIHSDLPILVLTIQETKSCADRAFDAGASGYVTKRQTPETLLVAIRCVLSGGSFVSKDI